MSCAAHTRRSSGCRCSCARRFKRCTSSIAATWCCTARSGIRKEGDRHMDFNKLTIKAQEAVAAAQELARRTGNPELYPEHLLVALLDQELVRSLVEAAGGRRGEVGRASANRGRGATADDLDGGITSTR